MKLIILLWLVKLIVFGGASTSPCTTPDCGEKEFAMKDVKFNIDFNLGEILSKSKTKCDVPSAPIPAVPTHDCKDVFKAVDPYSRSHTYMVTNNQLLSYLQVNTGDSIRCEIEEINIPDSLSGPKQIGADLHTEPIQKAVFMTAPSSKCFSFGVRASNDAKIILTNKISETDRIEITLGTNHNTDISYKVMRNTCVFRKEYSKTYLLSEYEFIDYWICWANGTAILGRDDDIILGGNEKMEIKDPIEYIGLETLANAVGTWKIYESNCPGCYEVKEEGNNARVSCVKVQNTCQQFNDFKI